MVEEAEYAENTIKLQKEDLLVMYTDGVTEVVNPKNQEFGRERLKTLIRAANHMPVKEMIQKIKLSLEEFSKDKPFADDTTIVISRIA